jgi:dTDP-4-dehydrorhamnose reductase
MNVAITGACGLLGGHLAARLSADHRVVGFDRHPWWGSRPIELHRGDLTDDVARNAFVEDARPELLIHCAAMVNVDACEARPADAYLANGTVTGRLVRGLPLGCRVVYVTTDGIFRGDRAMLTESDLPCPRTVYGRSKLHGEWETALTTDNHLIVRTNFFGWSSGAKATSAEWLYHALSSRDPINLFDDFFFTPLYVVDLVESILDLVAGGHTGTFNVVGADRVSKYQFGECMAQAGGLSFDGVSRGSIAAAALLADRPRDMSLSTEKIAHALGHLMPSCSAGVRRFIADRRRTLEERVAESRPAALAP